MHLITLTLCRYEPHFFHSVREMLGTKPTLLIVDDEVTNLEIMVEILEENPVSYRILRANHGEIALQLARQRRPDLVISDWDMPGMSGIELVRALKADALTREIPVIMCSGVMTSSENLQQALEAGAVDYVRKPLDAIELKARVHSMLELGRSYREIRRLSARKDAMFGTISHSLLTSVGNLYTMLGLIREIWAHERHEAIQLLTQSNAKAHEVLELLKNLLAWSRCYFDEFEYRPEPVPLDQLVKSLKIELAELSAEQEIFVGTQIPADLAVEADIEMLQQILRQLILNGLRFARGRDRITISADLYQGDKVRIQVRDTGRGISPELLQRLRDHSQPTPEVPGAGIGLKIVAELLARHGSELELASAPGEGTTAGFVLPLAVRSGR